MASFAKRGSHWQCRVYSAVLNKGIARSAPTKREALRKAEERRRELEIGLSADGDRLTLRDYLRRWLDQHAAHVALQTLHGYRTRLERYVIPELGHIRLARLRTADVQELYGRLAVSGRRDGRPGGLHPRTIIGIHVALHKALEDAVRMQYVARNVAHAAVPPPAPKRLIEAPNAASAHKFLNALRDTPVEAEVTFAMFTGLREGELLALRWADVDESRAAIRVHRSVGRVPGHGLVVKEPKTVQSVRAVPLLAEPLDVVRRQRAHIAAQRLRVGPPWHDDGLVFPTETGTFQDARNLLRRFHRALDRAGLARLRWHDLRHWTASLMIAAGMDLVMVSRALGHSSIQVTADIYGHIDVETLRAEMQKFGRLMESVAL